MARIQIRTTDTGWATANSTNIIPEGDAVLVTVTVDNVQRVRFAGRDMIRFDLGAVANRLPKDWASRHAMVPAHYLVAGRARTATTR